MIAIVEHVVVICLGWQQPKKFCEQSTFGHLFSKIMLKRSKNATHANFFSRKVRSHPSPMHPIIAIGPFSKWGIDFTTCHPPLAQGHRYIIIVVDYFTKWAEAMPTYLNDGKTTTLFTFSHIISKFIIPKKLVTDHGSHFQNAMMTELFAQLGIRQEHYSPYYP